MSQHIRVTAEVLVPIGDDTDLSEKDLETMEYDICSDLANIFFDFEAMEVKVELC